MAREGNRFTLTVSTWRKEDPLARHYYGRIRSKVYGEVDLEKRYATCRTIRFETFEEVLDEAKRWFLKHGRDGDVLVLPVGFGEVLFERCSHAKKENDPKKAVNVPVPAPTKDQKIQYEQQAVAQRRV